MANSTLQMVAEALRESQDEDDGAWHFDCEAGAQAAISAFKQSDEWKGVVEALELCREAMKGAEMIVNIALKGGGAFAAEISECEYPAVQRAIRALNKLNGGA